MLIVELAPGQRFVEPVVEPVPHLSPGRCFGSTRDGRGTKAWRKFTPSGAMGTESRHRVT
jgi:hypothetical protein